MDHVEQYSDQVKSMHAPGSSKGVSDTSSTSPVKKALSTQVTPPQVDSDTSKTMPIPSTYQLPIPPASEPMQYRAIGLVHGQYVPSDAQFTRGEILAADGQSVQAVLLGRVMSLVKKHVDLAQPHLWVVYPRTREKKLDLHVQIVGIWEPETLAQVQSDTLEEATDELSTDEEGSTLATDEEAIAATEAEETETEAETAASHSADVSEDVEDPAPSTEELEPKPVLQLVRPNRPEPVAPPAESEPKAEGEVPQLQDGYFSIRGEIVHLGDEDDQITVRIQQTSRKNPEEDKSFKLILTGHLEGRVIGQFWNLHVRRHNQELVIEGGERIGVARPKKMPKPARPRSKPGKGGMRRPATRKSLPQPKDRDGVSQKPVSHSSEEPKAEIASVQAPDTSPSTTESQD
jgi:hypothetical protein